MDSWVPSTASQTQKASVIVEPMVTILHTIERIVTIVAGCHRYRGHNNKVGSETEMWKITTSETPQQVSYLYIDCLRLWVRPLGGVFRTSDNTSISFSPLPTTASSLSLEPRVCPGSRVVLILLDTRRSLFKVPS